MRPVNLLPQDQRRQGTSALPGSAYAVVGGLALLLAMAVAYVLTSNAVDQRTADADAARAEADQLEAQARQLGSFTNFADVRATRLASVRDVAESRFDWERLMRELSHIVPRGSWVQTTDASVTPTADDVATSPGAVGPSGPTATFVGCTPDQEDTARMMVRMRRMHRVADVRLNESARGGTLDDAATVDNCGRLYQFDVTVEFEPTAPAKDAPRGTDAVPVSLGGGS